MIGEEVVAEAQPICTDSTGHWEAREPMQLLKLTKRTWQPTSLMLVFDEGNQFCHRKFVSSREVGRRILRRWDGVKVTKAQLEAEGWEYMR